MPATDRRPTDPYFETRLSMLSQGDIFRDVPLAYPLPAVEIALEEAPGDRRFLSGPFDVGPAILLTPTCSMRDQKDPTTYAHPVRTLAPLRTVVELEKQGVLDRSKLALAQKRDGLINYMYIPASEELGIEESLALLYMPVTLHHDMVATSRVTQLSFAGARQLQRKLAWHATSLYIDLQDFDPPMD